MRFKEQETRLTLQEHDDDDDDDIYIYIYIYTHIYKTLNVIGSAAAKVALFIFKFYPFHDSSYKQPMSNSLYVYFILVNIQNIVTHQEIYYSEYRFRNVTFNFRH